MRGFRFFVNSPLVSRKGTRERRPPARPPLAPEQGARRRPRAPTRPLGGHPVLGRLFRHSARSETCGPGAVSALRAADCPAAANGPDAGPPRWGSRGPIVPPTGAACSGAGGGTPRETPRVDPSRLPRASDAPQSGRWRPGGAPATLHRRGCAAPQARPPSGAGHNKTAQRAGAHAPLPPPGGPVAGVCAERRSEARGACLTAVEQWVRRVVGARRAPPRGGMPPRPRLRAPLWAQGACGGSPGSSATRSMRKRLVGQWRASRYAHSTTAGAAPPPGTSPQPVGPTAGLRSWLAQGFPPRPQACGGAAGRCPASHALGKWGARGWRASRRVRCQASRGTDRAGRRREAGRAGAQGAHGPPPAATPAGWPPQHGWVPGQGGQNSLQHGRQRLPRPALLGADRASRRRSVWAAGRLDAFPCPQAGWHGLGPTVTAED
jgi:hypothetical protein